MKLLHLTRLSTIRENPIVPFALLLDSTKISNVTYLGSSTLGLRGMGIDYDGYSFKAGKYDFRIAMGSIPGMKNMCYPVLEDIKQRKYLTLDRNWPER